jgi:hypothetical protein
MANAMLDARQEGDWLLDPQRVAARYCDVRCLQAMAPCRLALEIRMVMPVATLQQFHRDWVRLAQASPAWAAPAKRKPNRRMMEVDTAIGRCGHSP